MARDPQATAIGDGLRAAVGNVIKALTLEVTANLIEDCPIDTGHVRANFVPSVGEPHDGVDDGAAQRAGQAAILSYKLGDGTAMISNNVDYLRFLLLGSSAQAPAGWDLAAVDRAVATIQARHDDLSIALGANAAVTITPKGEP